MSQKQSKLVSGVAILSLAGIISKIIGMVFRIPLTNTIGSAGLGVYTTVYNNYILLLTVSTAGIPVGISRLVAESVSQHKHKQAKAILRTALLLLAGIGLLLTILLIFFSKTIAVKIATEPEYIGFIAIAPSILLVSLMSAFRGYMQGRENMMPTAISQLIEQLAKVIISFPLATIGLKTSSIHAAAGALLGITIGEALALLYMVAVYLQKRKTFYGNHAAYGNASEHGKSVESGSIVAEISETASFGALAKQLAVIALPITVGSMIVPLSGSVDTILVRFRLIVAGFTGEAAVSLLGLLHGSALSLVNVPTVLATAVCIGLVPVISVARIENRVSDMHEVSRLGLRIASLISLPCTIGLSMLATPIIRLLFKLPAEEIIQTGEMLSISALTIFFFTHVQATTGILQGAGMQQVPMYSLVAGVAMKIILDYVLIAIPSINIYGSPIASIVCYGVSMMINYGWIFAKTGMKMDWGGVVFRPGAATLGMGIAVLLAMRVFDLGRGINTLIVVFIGVFIYIVLAFVVGALKREDMETIPGGKQIEKLMLKLRVWR